MDVKPVVRRSVANESGRRSRDLKCGMVVGDIGIACSALLVQAFRTGPCLRREWAACVLVNDGLPIGLPASSITSCVVRTGACTQPPSGVCMQGP